MELKLISELGVNDTLAVLEPAKVCVGHCTWCYAQLNRRSNGLAMRTEAPDTFRLNVNKAFGPAYDPQDLLQWGLRHKLPVTWSSGVEPWQDLAAAGAAWDVIERLDLPVFVQTRGTNWREVFPRLRAHAEQSCLYVSLPSDDPAYVKRFEPGTPQVAERLALVDAAVAAGVPTMAALAPYRPEWCADPAALVADLARRGVGGLLFDPLHLNLRQRQTCGDREAVRLAALGWDDALVAHAQAVRDAAAALGLSLWVTDRRGLQYDVGSRGAWDRVRYRDATHLRYHDERWLELVERLATADERPLLLTWDQCLAVMEEHGTIDQPFRWAPFRGAFLQCAKLVPQWQARLRPAAPLRDYLRAFWNTPGKRGFVWSAPFTRLAVGAGGRPLVSSTGDAVLAYDPWNDSRQAVQRVDEPEDWDVFAYDREVGRGQRRRWGRG